MKIKIKSLVLMLISAFVVTACGGSSSDSGGGIMTGTFTKEIMYPDGAYQVSFFGLTPQGRNMMLYLANDIKGSGLISSISFKRKIAMSADTTFTNVTIKMGHTNISTLNAAYGSNYNTGQGSLQVVLNNASITVPAGAAEEYFTISLSTPFNYNGVDNLVVDFIRTSSNDEPMCIRTHLANPEYYGLCLNGSSVLNPGDLYKHVADTKFTFAGGNNKIYSSDGLSINAVPFSTTYSINKMQLLYNADSIAGSGLISGIGFLAGSTTTKQTYTYTIRLGHSTKINLDTTWENNFNSGSPVTVANEVDFTIPAGIPTGGLIWIPIPDGSFIYNGKDNLLLEITVNDSSSATGSVSLACYSTANVNYLSGSPANTTATTPGNIAYHINFRFYGGTMDVITKGTMSIAYPYSGNWNNKQQYLYAASELGTKGNITKVAYRLDDDSNLSDYNSFNIVLGHTADLILGDTSFSANMTDAQNVYNGTVSIPAGLKAGDWIEIPLSTPFAYNGVNNLVVQTSNLKGTAYNYTRSESSATHYLNRRVYSANHTEEDPAGRDDFLADIRLEIK